MTDQDLSSFVENIEKVLEKNGFPSKKVSLPLEKLYESAYEKGLNFNKALEVLATKNIQHEKTNEKIIFHLAEIVPEGFPGDLDMSKMMEGMDPEMFNDPKFKGIMEQAANMMKNMSPDELDNIKKMAENMSPEEKEEMMNKAKGIL